MIAPVLIMEVFTQLMAGLLLWAMSRRERDSGLRLWASGFVINALTALMASHQLTGPENPVLSGMEALLGVVGAVCLIQGTLRFLGRRLPRWIIALPVGVAALSMITAVLELSFEVRAVPVLLLMSCGLIFVGVSVGREHPRSWGGRVTGVSLSLLGLHILDYPLFARVPEFLAWGHGVAAALEMMAFTGFILLTLERAAARLSVQEARYHALFDNAAVGIFVVDAQGTLVAANATLKALVAPGQELEGKQLSALYAHPQEAEALLAGRSAPLASHAVRWKTLDGRELNVQLYARHVTGANGTTSLEGVVVDVTRLEHLQRHLDQVQRAELLGQLAGGIAHDINNVLGVVLASAELLKRTAGTEGRNAELVGGILTAGNQGAGLTRQLLGFSRRQGEKPTSFELGDRVARVAGMLRPSLGDGVDLVLETRAQGCQIVADPGLIEQLVVNLVLNARDAISETGRIAITVSPEPAGSATPQKVLLEISDNGVGMTPDTLRKAFEPFFSTKAQGTGLGLAVVKRVVSQSDGELKVESAPGQGTVFQVRFPASAPNA